MMNRLMIFGFFAMAFSFFGAIAATPGDKVAIGEHTFDANGLKLWYKVSGKGPLCIMPTPAWGPSADLYFLSLQIMETRFTMVYLDTRGIGRSEAPASTKDYTWEHLSSDIDALREHLGQEKVWLMGHSEGGIQIQHYTCEHPEKVNGMVLLDTAAAWDVDHEVDMSFRMIRRADEPWYYEALIALGSPRETDEEFKKHMMTAMPFYWNDPQRVKFSAEVFAATTFRAAASKGQKDSGRYPFDLREKLGKLSTPAVIIVGEEDYICSPVAASRMHLALKNSKLLVIRDAGHFPWIEQQKAFDQNAMEFLDHLLLRATD